MIDSRDKEVIKTIQAKTEIINKLEDKASKVLVLELGSYSIKMGFANQKVPFIVRPFIAYRRTNPCFDKNEARLYDDIDIGAFKKEYSEIEGYLKSEGIIVSEHRPVKGKPRGKQNISLSYPPQPAKQDIMYEDEALAVEDSPEYIFRKPIRHGQLNIQDSSLEAINECLNDIEKLLRFTLKEKMKIPEKEWRSFSCILVVPDVFIRQHVKMLVTMIFSKIEFARMYMHQESVLACLGMAIGSAVVVDIGHEKINICCIDEGVILPKTLIRKNFGLKYISKTMTKLFNSKINEEGHDLFVNSQCDLSQVDQIKQLGCCVREPEQNSNKVYQLKTYHSMKPIEISINYNDVLCIGANSIFFTIWNCFPFETSLYREAFDSYSELYDLQYDPDDMFEEFSGGGHVLEIEEENDEYEREISNPYSYQPLSDLVAASILSIKEPDARKKFLTSVFIIGGGGLLPQLTEELLQRLNKIFETADSDDKAESASDLYGKEIDMSYASWLGGTVLPKLDSLRDLWIERGKYLGSIKEEMIDPEEEGGIDKKLFTRKEESQEWGIRYLKEKIPFLW